MLKELREFKALIEEKKAKEEEIKQFLNRTVFEHRILLHKIPKSEKLLEETIKNALILSKDKYSWVNLSIYDPFLDKVYVFGRKKDILRDLKRIVKMIVLRQESVIGYTGISLIPGRFSLFSFVKL